MMIRYRSIAVGLAAATMLAVPGATASAQILEVAIKGGPGPEPDSQYRNFRRPVASDAPAARTAFTGKYRGTGGSAQGIFYDDPVAAGSTIVLKRQLAPNGQQFRRMGRPSINSTGAVAWSARLTGDFNGIFQQGPANVILVGDLVPPPLNGSLDDFGRPDRADNGAVVFYATISGGSILNGLLVDEGIFRCNGGDFDCTTGSGILETLVVKSDEISDRPGRFICTLRDTVSASSLGMAFRASTKLNCSDPGEAPLEGIFRWSGGVVATVALQGEQAEPFLGVGGTTYGSFTSGPAMANDGTVAFSVRTAGVLDTVSIYRCDTAACPGLPAKSIVQGGNVDGLGATVSSYFTGIGISNALDVVFYTRVNDPDGRRGRAIYVHRFATNSLERIVTKEDPAPGAAPSQFRRILFPPDISSAGRISFGAKVRRLTGGGVNGVYLAE